MPIITEFKEKGKGISFTVPEGVLTVIVVVLASTLSFGLGYLSGKENGGGGVYIENPKETVSEVSGTPLSASNKALLASPTASLKASETTEAPVPQVDAGGKYVASKKGSKYHLPWCPGAKTINEENKIYFDSKEEAESAGYTPAANCKGI